MDAHGRGLLGRNLRNAVGYVECIRSSDYLYSAGECAGTCGSDADRQVRYRHEQDGRGAGDNYCYSGGDCGDPE